MAWRIVAALHSGLQTLLSGEKLINPFMVQAWVLNIKSEKLLLYDSVHFLLFLPNLIKTTLETYEWNVKQSAKAEANDYFHHQFICKKNISDNSMNHLAYKMSKK